MDACDLDRHFQAFGDVNATMTAFDEARRTASTFRVEHRIRSADGRCRWFLVRAEPHRDPGTGEVVRWSLIGGSAAFLLSVPQDFVLLLSGVLALLARWAWRRQAGGGAVAGIS